MEEWKRNNIYNAPQVPLTELLDFIVDNRGKTVPTSEKGIALIATNCIKNEFLYPVYEKVRYVSQDIYETWFRSHPQPGDIIFVNKGTPGKTALVPNPVNFCIAQDMMAFRLKPDVVYNRYLLAVLRSREIQHFITNNQVGTIIPHFKKEQLKTLMIPLPEMRLQKEIGDIYFYFSEKAEVNRRINENLEQQAQALFKSWFVDFEPFRDQPFVESELGMIPEGWRVDCLSSIADYVNGLAMQKYRPNDRECGIPVLKIKELGQGCCDGNSELCSPSLIGKKYIIENGDIIFSWSGTLMVKVWCGGRCGLNQHLFVVNPKKYSKWFVYLWTKYHLNNFIHIAKDKAVTMGHIKRGELDKAMSLIPSQEVMNKMDSIMKPIHEKIISNELLSCNLRTLRDTLLPRLMSGELKVQEIEESL